MSLVITQTLTAVCPNITSSFFTAGGSSPYVYAVAPNGAGGTINSSTGLYTAPTVIGTTPQTLIDTIQVTDAGSNTTSATILVGTPLHLLCDILQNGLSLPQGRVYLWNQKVFQPTDSGMYIAVSMPRARAFANNKTYDSNGNVIQTINMLGYVDIDIMSRDSSARDQKEFVPMALQSDYSELQQEANSFLIGRLPAGSQFVNLSAIDGAAIPYRYKISVQMQYGQIKTQPTPYFSSFSSVVVVTNP